MKFVSANCLLITNEKNLTHYNHKNTLLINKPITGKSSLLKEFISDAQYQRMERAKKLFLIRMVVSYPPFIKKNGKNQYKLVQRMSDKEFRTEVGKIPNDFANDM